MLQKKKPLIPKSAPQSFKEFMRSSLIVGYSGGSKRAMETTPHVLSSEEIRSMRAKGGIILPRYGFKYPRQVAMKGSRAD